jgi:integrase
VQVSTVGGRKIRYRRLGYPARESALRARRALLDAPAAQATAAAWTTARWLRHWLCMAEPGLRPSTLHSYRDHLDRFLIPTLGRIALANLTGARLQGCFDLLARRRTSRGTPLAAATVDRIRATMRSALNAAVREGLLPACPMAYVKVARPVRPHPVVWTDERVTAWRRGGTRQPVAVCTLPQLVRFLAGIENDRLAAMWWLVALRGLRRGEIAGLTIGDLDAAARELTVSRQQLALPGELYCSPPKSRASCRTIALDADCARRLAEHAGRQGEQTASPGQRRHDGRSRTGPSWNPGRAMFTYADGRPVRPEYITHRFAQLTRELGLPPIRLHDLRHQAATLGLAAHADLKVIQQMLGHSSIITTADTYTSVLPDVAHRAAQATADMVTRAASLPPGGTSVPHGPEDANTSCYRRA